MHPFGRARLFLAALILAAGPSACRPAPTVAPPPWLIEVTSIDSDAGLTRGQTLEVFRFGTSPKWVGRIRIVEVMQTQAVGTAMGKLTTPIQVGDRVASRIVGGY